LKSLQKKAKRKAIDDGLGNIRFSGVDETDQYIINPTEIADLKWNEFEKKNPELAKS